MNRTQVMQALEALRKDTLCLASGESGFGLVGQLSAGAMGRLERAAPNQPGFAIVTAAPHLQPLLRRAPRPLELRLMERFWPGPVVLGLPARFSVPRALVDEGHVRIWMSGSPPLQELVSRISAPLAFIPVMNERGEQAVGLAEAVDIIGRNAYAAAIAEAPSRCEPLRLLRVEDEVVRAEHGTLLDDDELAAIRTLGLQVDAP